MAQGGGVHTTMNVAVGGIVSINEGELVGIAGLVGMAVGMLNQPLFIRFKEMMMMQKMIAKIAKVPIMILGFIRFS
jgi:hypothetical protein